MRGGFTAQHALSVVLNVPKEALWELECPAEFKHITVSARCFRINSGVKTYVLFPTETVNLDAPPEEVGVLVNKESAQALGWAAYEY